VRGPLRKSGGDAFGRLDRKREIGAVPERLVETISGNANCRQRSSVSVRQISLARAAP
jgi:hypothetical protein